MLRLVICMLLMLTPLALRADEAKPAPQPPKSGVSMAEIRQFTAVFDLIKQAYVDPVNDKALMQSAIRGMLAGLDPHSEYLDQTGVQALNEDTSGSYDGLGIEVVTLNGALRVIAPIDDTPAARAGIKPGDIIVRIDGKAITRKTRTRPWTCCAARPARK